MSVFSQFGHFLGRPGWSLGSQKWNSFFGQYKCSSPDHFSLDLPEGAAMRQLCQMKSQAKDEDAASLQTHQQCHRPCFTPQQYEIM